MSGVLWICEVCGNYYGGPENLVCSCADAAPRLEECGFWQGAVDEDHASPTQCQRSRRTTWTTENSTR